MQSTASQGLKLEEQNTLEGPLHQLEEQLHSQLGGRLLGALLSLCFAAYELDAWVSSWRLRVEVIY